MLTLERIAELLTAKEHLKKYCQIKRLAVKYTLTAHRGPTPQFRGSIKTQHYLPMPYVLNLT